MLPYQLAFAGFAFPLVFPLRLPFPAFAVFSADLFPDFAEAVLSFLFVVFFAVSLFFPGVVSADDFFFSWVALGLGEAFLLGLGLGEGFGDGFGSALGDG